MSAEQEILQECRVIAVIGLSDNPDRASYHVAHYLMDQGYRVIPVNPMVKWVLGQTSYPDLDSVPVAVDVVDIFRRSEEVPELVEQAIRKGARVVWMQEGVVHEAAAERARGAGLKVVMDKCMRKEHARMLGPPHPPWA